MLWAFPIAARNREDIKEYGKYDYRTTNIGKTDLAAPSGMISNFLFKARRFPAACISF